MSFKNVISWLLVFCVLKAFSPEISHFSPKMLHFVHKTLQFIKKVRKNT